MQSNMHNLILPHADSKTIVFVSDFCYRSLCEYGYCALYFFGSRAVGKHRPNSDHDFLAVVSDEAPPEITSGCSLGLKIFEKLETERTREGLGQIDFLTMRANSFFADSNKPGSFAYSAAKGIKLWSN